MSIRSICNTQGTNESKIRGDMLAIDVAGTISKSYTTNGSILLTGSGGGASNLNAVLTAGNDAGNLNILNVDNLTLNNDLNFSASGTINSNNNLLIVNSGSANTEIEANEIDLTATNHISMVGTEILMAGEVSILSGNQPVLINTGSNNIDLTATDINVTGNLQLIGSGGNSMCCFQDTASGPIDVRLISVADINDITYTGLGEFVLQHGPTIIGPIINSQTATGDYTLVQGAVNVITAHYTGAANDTLVLDSGNVLINETSMVSSTARLEVSGGDISIRGSSSGTLNFGAPAIAGTDSKIVFPGASFDFSTSGGTSQVVKQTSSGGAFSVGQLAVTDLSTSTTGSGSIVLATNASITTPTITNPVVTNLNPGANFTITQNSVIPFTSVNAGAVVNTLYLTTGKVLIGETAIVSSTAKFEVKGNIAMAGATSGSLTFACPAVAGSNSKITFPSGIIDFSSTGGTSQVLRQSSAGSAITVSQLAASDLSNGTTGSGAVVLANSPSITGLSFTNLAFSGTLTQTAPGAIQLTSGSNDMTFNVTSGNGFIVNADPTFTCAYYSAQASTSCAMYAGTGATEAQFILQSTAPGVQMSCGTGCNWISGSGNTTFDCAGQSFIINGVSGSTQINTDGLICGSITYFNNASFNLPNITSNTGTALVSNGGGIYLLTSSGRFKENVKDLAIDTSALYDLKAVTYNYKESSNSGFGYIAEDVPASLHPLIVNNDKEGLPYSINYQQICVLQNEELKKLNKRLLALENK